MARKILHLDLDAFFCSVEEILHPSLVGKAFAVGGSPQGRGVIASCSYQARKFGVRSAMPAGKALSLCPGLLFVHHQHHLYGEYSDKVMQILEELTPLVQQVSVDEAFLDVSDLLLPLLSIATDLQKRVQDELSLPCSIGGATSKLVAKIANDYGKASVQTGKAPRKITIIPEGHEKDFLAPLDVQAMWGIGPKTSQKLHSLGVHTIGQMAELSLAELSRFFGNGAQEIKERSRGIDPSPVHSDHALKSVSNERTYREDTEDKTVMLQTLRSLADQVGYRLRKANLAGSVVHLKLRYHDFTTFTRQTALDHCTNLDDEIYTEVKDLLEKNLLPNRAVRLLGVGVSGLDVPHRQLSLWGDPDIKKEQLTGAVDKLKEKYGKDIIKRGNMLKPPKEKP